jgi:beta-phosphoglucomutase
VVKLLEALDDAGYLQALVSSTPLENINLIIGSLGIRRYFRQTASGYDVTEGKPSPQGYLLAADRLGVAPRQCIVIEDAMAGIEAARAGGMKCIAVTTTHPAEKLKAADLVVSSLETVTMAMVEKLLKCK